MKHKTHFFALVVTVCNSFLSCDSFLEVQVDKSKITKDLVFSNDATAIAALNGVYSDMYNTFTSFASGSYNSITGVCAMSAGELDYYPEVPSYQSFGKYSLEPNNENVFNLWKSMYYAIYGANGILEGLNDSNLVSEDLKNQLIGESLFVRSFCYFYLVNLFGDVPLVLTTDYRETSRLERTDSEVIYDQIVDDLLRSDSLLSDDYLGNERIRPNKALTRAMLSRVYLFLNKFDLSESLATEVINDDRYHLLKDLNQVFLMNSNEAIWQLRPSSEFYNTYEGSIFILQGAPMFSSYQPFAISNSAMSVFEGGDLRRRYWVDSLVFEDDVYYYPFKYKNPGGELTEYSSVLRLSEVYLIRAESRARQGKIVEAISDIDSIRSRAGVSLIGISEAEFSNDSILSIIEFERQRELFSEWGHRWLDLKRTNRCDIVLGDRQGYHPDSKLYPIPQFEIDRSSDRIKQNDGY